VHYFDNENKKDYHSYFDFTSGKKIYGEATALKMEQNRLPSKKFSYVDRGRYYKQIMHILTMFPTEQLHIIKYLDEFFS